MGHGTYRKKTKEAVMAPLVGTEEEILVDSLYAKHQNKQKQEAELDKEKGFDVYDPNSVARFDIGYTPTGNTVIVKEIYEEKSVGGVLLPDTMTDLKVAVVVVPGLYVSALKPGDKVMFKKDPNGKNPDFVPRIFKDIRFSEVDWYAIAGVFQSREIMLQRINGTNIQSV